MKYERLASNGVRWHASPRFAPLVRAGAFADFERVRREAAIVKDLRSKRTVEFAAGGSTWIIRIHKPGSMWRRLADTVRGTRARRELRASRDVERTGVPTVPVEAIAEWRGGSAAVFEKLQGWDSLERTLRARPDPAMLRSYGAFARNAHDAGILQEDFNPSNILVRDGRMLLIDFERLRVAARLTETRRLALLAKLLRLRTVGRDGLDSFLEGYLRPDEPRDQARARILALWERQLAADRAHIARACTGENRNFGRVETEGHVVHYRKPAENRDGLTASEAARVPLRPAELALRDHDDALRAWREANADALTGGEPPLAVALGRRERRGFVAYRRRPVST